MLIAFHCHYFPFEDDDLLGFLEFQRLKQWHASGIRSKTFPGTKGHLPLPFFKDSLVYACFIKIYNFKV